MSRLLAGAAVSAALLHLLAGFGTLLFLVGGTPVEPDPLRREAFVSGHPGGWALGWALWILASASLVAFYAILVAESGLGRAAVALAAAGLAVDLAAGSGFLALALPRFSGELRLSVEGWAFDAAGILANGLYTLGGILAVVSAWRARLVGTRVALASVPLWIAGSGLVVGTLVDSVGVSVASAAALVPSSVAWFLLVGASAWRASSS